MVHEIPNLISVSAAFMAALSGSLHCVGMCGPIRLLASHSKGAWWKYQAGRGLAYATLGLAAGKVGEKLNIVGWLLMVAIILGLFFLKIPLLQKLRSRLYQRFQNYAFVWGLGSGLLPCGLLHLWILAAAASQSAIQGMALLGILWIGSLPALEGSALFLKEPLQKLRAHFPRAIPMAFLFIALLPLVWRMPAFSKEETNKPSPPSCHHSSSP